MSSVPADIDVAAAPQAEEDPRGPSRSPRGCLRPSRRLTLSGPQGEAIRAPDTYQSANAEKMDHFHWVPRWTVGPRESVTQVAGWSSGAALPGDDPLQIGIAAGDAFRAPGVVAERERVHDVAADAACHVAKARRRRNQTAQKAFRALPDIGAACHGSDNGLFL